MQAEQVPKKVPLLSTVVVLAVCVVVSSQGQGISQLYFTTEPSSVTAQVGESVILPCHASGEQPINITWFRGTEQLRNRTGESEIHPDGSLWLRLSGEVFDTNSESQVEVIHRCCATNARGMLCSPSVSVIATAPPSKPVVLPQRLDVLQNTSARLQCKTNDGSSQYSVRWQKDGQELQPSSRYVHLPSGILQIYTVQPVDAGEYRCITGTPPTPLTTSESSQLTVVVSKPTSSNETSGVGDPEELTAIVAGPGDVTMMSSGGRIILECLAAGSWVDITWSINGGRLLPEGRSHFVGHKNLELTGLIPDDSGVYMCEATDTRTEKFSLASALVQIDDFYLPYFTVRPRSGEIDNVATLRLRCSADGNPQPTITWYHNGKLITPSRHVTHNLDDNDLVIWFVSKKHEGVYQCFASNVVGTVQSSALVTVKVDANRPDPPYNLTTQTIDSNTIGISWQVAKGIHLFSLHVYIEPDGEETQHVLADQPANSYRVQDLRPFTNYTFYMRAYNTSSSGNSELVLGQTAEGVPRVSPNFWLTSIAANIVVYWDCITDFKQSRGYINAYRICYQERERPQEYTCSEVDHFQDTYRILGLKPGTVYDVQVAAATHVGFGPDSAVQSIRTMDAGNCSVPLMFPLEPPVILNDTEVLLAWSQRITEGSIPVTGFLLQLSEVTQGGGIDLRPGTFSYVFSDLLPGLQYTATLMAYNDCGVGPTSLQTFTMPSISEDGNSYPPPENVQVNALSSNSMKISWNPVLEVSRPFYKVIYWQNGYRWKEPPMEVYRQATSALLTDLKPFTIYVLQVRVHQQGVIGQYSEEVLCRTAEDRPSAPVNFTAMPIDPHTVSVAWRPPLSPNGVIKMYNIRYMHVPHKLEEQPEINWNNTHKNGTDTSATIRNLSSNTKYYFLLAACTSVGEGQATTVEEVKMPQEANFEVGSGTSTEPGLNSDVEKGVLIAVLLGSVCLILCTLMTAIRFKRYQTTRNRQMEAQAASTHYNGVIVSQRVAASGSHGLEMTVLSPMLGNGNRQHQIRHPNAQIHCESPLLSANQHHPNTLAPHTESPTQQPQDGEHSEPLPRAEHCAEDLQHYRHTLPGSSAHPPTAKHGCSVSLPESGCEDTGGEDTGEGPSHWTPLRESTSGDSGLIGDMEFAASEDTSPDFIDKVLREFHISVPQV